MARRSYGSGSLVVRADGNGMETWYGLWRSDRRRVKRSLGPKRSAGSRYGLTRTQAEAELRRRMQEGAVVIGRAERKTFGEAGERYVGHLATVKRRKRTTIQDYRGYLRRHLVPHFGERPGGRHVELPQERAALPVELGRRHTRPLALPSTPKPATACSGQANSSEWGYGWA